MTKLIHAGLRWCCKGGAPLAAVPHLPSCFHAGMGPESRVWLKSMVVKAPMLSFMPHRGGIGPALHCVIRHHQQGGTSSRKQAGRAALARDCWLLRILLMLII